MFPFVVKSVRSQSSLCMYVCVCVWFGAHLEFVQCERLTQHIAAFGSG